MYTTCSHTNRETVHAIQISTYLILQQWDLILTANVIASYKMFTEMFYKTAFYTPNQFAEAQKTFTATYLSEMIISLDLMDMLLKYHAAKLSR